MAVSQAAARALGVPALRDATLAIYSAGAEHARHVNDTIEAGYRAVETGQTQELGTMFEPLPIDAL